MVKLNPSAIKWKPAAFIAGLFLLFCLISNVSSAQSEYAYANALDKYAPLMLHRYEVPGAVVALIKNGEVIWTKAYGVAEKETGKLMRPDMLFEFGSAGKVITAWGVMRFVEERRVELDKPVNRYLKRWKLPSDSFKSDEVTIRRILSHTAGLNNPGYANFSLKRRLPTLVEALDGNYQFAEPLRIVQKPGSGYLYSGGGYALLQMVIEDVSGEPFEQFIRREVTNPLGVYGIYWTWTPELQKRAATPYGMQGEPVGFRRLGIQGIGSEICTVTDFARFAAAALPSPNGEPAGRGVLSPETIRLMTSPHPEAEKTAGLAYHFIDLDGRIYLNHNGWNTGWMASMNLDPATGDGLVIATNSDNGDSFYSAARRLWWNITAGTKLNIDEPATTKDNIVKRMETLVSVALLLPLMLSLAVFFRRLGQQKIRWTRLPRTNGLLAASVWLLITLFWWYWIYCPWQQPFPPSFPDFWPTPQTGWILGLLVLYTFFNLASAFTDRTT